MAAKQASKLHLMELGMITNATSELELEPQIGVGVVQKSHAHRLFIFLFEDDGSSKEFAKGYYVQ